MLSLTLSHIPGATRRRVVDMVQKRYPSSELLAAGWSLGANILVRYLGEEGSRSPISAAASLCNPLDLVQPSLQGSAPQPAYSVVHGLLSAAAVLQATMSGPLCVRHFSTLVAA